MKQEEVRQRFNEFLETYKLSVVKVSKETGLDYTNLTKFRSGTRPYSSERLSKISNYMDVYTNKVNRNTISDTKKADIIVSYLSKHLKSDTEELKKPILKALKEIEEEETHKTK